MTRRAQHIVGACSLALALLLAGPALAQAATTTISGTVMGATTHQPVHAQVVVNYAYAGGNYQPAGETATAADGTYSVAITAGPSVTVEFVPYGCYEDQYWDGINGSEESATLVATNTGSPITGIDGSLISYTSGACATQPSLSVADTSIAEPTGASATMSFAVSLSAAQTTPVTVDYGTTDGSAIAGTDYDAVSGMLTFPAGTTTETVSVPVLDVGPEGDKTFSLGLSGPSGATLSRATATGTIHGRTPLLASVSVSPTPVVQETPGGPKPVLVTATVTLKNVGKQTITDATLPGHLTIGWHLPALGSTVPATQTAAPATLDLGTLAPGTSASADYTLQVTGDGSLDVQALATGAIGAETITGFGTTLFQPDSQLLVFSATLGAKVNSLSHPGLIRAGTSFLINLTLENRSNYRKIVVDPIYPTLAGNAADGSVFPSTVGFTGANPTGSEAEVEANPYIEIDPGQTVHYLAVVRTGASDAADTQTAVSGGTHASVTFDPPTVSVINPDNTTTDVAADHVVVVPGSSDFEVGIDDSGMTASPFSYLGATWAVSKGLVWGLWRATYGAVRGIVWDLPSLVVRGVYNLSTASLDYVDRIVELWTACDKDSACLDDLVNTAVDKVVESYAQAPEKLTESVANLTTSVRAAFIAHFAALEAEWDAGDWRAALTDFTSEATDTGVNVALLLGPAILARSPRAAAAWNSLKASTYAKVTDTLNLTLKALEPVRAAVLSLSKVVKPGYWFTEDQMASLFGVSDRESGLISALTKRLGVSVVLRSRASEAIKFIEDGVAVMKPYWIKTKNVSSIDVQALGYPESQVGKVVIRPPVSVAQCEANMLKAGYTRGSVQWQEGLARRLTRIKEYNGEYKQMLKWNKAQKVKGKWPWGDNGVDPRVQADVYSTFRFRLASQDGSSIPEIYVDGGWKFITGDIDLIAITKANGTALSDVEHVAILKQLATILGAQHPESATWINDGKFWFKAKENYLTNDGVCCLAQYGPDGVIRAVKFDSQLSDPTSWTKLAYRIYWKGGYQAGP